MTEAHVHFAKPLERYAFCKVHNRTLAKDLVQDAFIRAWLYLARGKTIDSMGPFLYHLLNCLIIDEYRKRKSASLEDLVEKGFEPVSQQDEYEKKLDIMEGRALVDLIKKLPSKYRVVLLLRFAENLSVDEICSKVHLSKNTVGVQLHRGIGKLRVLVAENLTVRH